MPSPYGGWHAYMLDCHSGIGGAQLLIRKFIVVARNFLIVAPNLNVIMWLLRMIKMYKRKGQVILVHKKESEMTFNKHI